MELGNILFYGGIVAMAVAALLGVTAFVVYKVRAARLKRCLEAEYGKREKKS